MTFLGVSGLLNSFICFCLGLFVFTRNPRNIRNRIYFLFDISIAFFSAMYFTWQSATEASSALLWFKMLVVGIILINATYVHFVTIFLGMMNKERLLAVYGNYALCFIFIAANLSGGFYDRVVPRFGLGYWPIPKLWFHFYLIFWFVEVLYGLHLLHKGVKGFSGIRQIQTKYVFISTLLGYIGGATNWPMWYSISIPPYLTIFISAYAAVLAYAIFRYQLMDIRIAATRTGIFVLIYCVVVGIPAFLIFQMRVFLEHQIGSSWWFLPAGLFALLCFTGPFIYLILQRKAEAVLLKEQRAYQQTLLQASRGMTLIKDLDHLLKLIVHILTKTVKITHARIFLWDNTAKQFVCRAVRGDHHKTGSDIVSEAAAFIQQLHAEKGPLILEEIRPHGSVSDLVVQEIETLDAAVVIPSFVQERLIGFVALGNKKSMGLYTESDLDILTTLANQAALAIENCIFLTEFEQQQAHFFQAAKMADLGTMASGIGHQVNNRFHVIRLGAESALMMEITKLENYFKNNGSEKEKKIVEGLSETCQRIANNATHGGEIVKRLLDFSRLAVGFKVMDVKEAVESSVRLWECKHDLKTISFHMETAPGLMKINGNFSEVEEVLFNLLDNAADAIKMKEEAFQLGNLPRPADYEKGTIWLKVCNEELNGKPHVLITVREDGIGMDEETQKRVFVPFFTTKATAIKGTGLGLYIMRRMVDAHQGRIKIESEYGKGTTFFVYLPAAGG